MSLTSQDFASRTFGAQGQANGPAYLRVSVATTEATQVPLEPSSERVQQASTQRMGQEQGETRFLSFIAADRFIKGETETRHYADMGYPRESLDDYTDYGENAPNDFKPELRGSLFSATLMGKEARP